MLKLVLDFKNEEFRIEGEEEGTSDVPDIRFAQIPDRALLYSAIAKLKKTLPELLNEVIIVEVSYGSVSIKREGNVIENQPARKIEAMLDKVKSNLR